ncbi:ankyrin repeat domain-containing protein [Demequina phytophila]|uniref:ankyrin repeat domain-containing protein n=1 Tax=Demequina phytophila TaxID=1638981 RepID=UPI000784BE5A|nr:ankyrin repeat domain-containing protein [Demequina phytophila]
MALGPPELQSTPASVEDRLVLAGDAAGRTMRGRASRALAGADGRARRRRRVRVAVATAAAAAIALALTSGVLRLADPELPLPDRLVASITAGDRVATAALIGDGALDELDARRPTEAVRLALTRCDQPMFRLLRDGGARRAADAGAAGQDVALVTVIRFCGPAVIREVWQGAVVRTPPIHLMVFAALEGSAAAVRTLAELGLPVDVPGGPSPLEAAIHAGRADVARALIDLGADTRRRTVDGIPLARLLDMIPNEFECTTMSPGERAVWRVACAALVHGGRP